VTITVSQSAGEGSVVDFASLAQSGLSMQDRAGLILACARSLYVNGQSTADVSAAVVRLAGKLGLEARFSPRWGELRLEMEDREGKLAVATTAEPTSVNMARVASTMRIIEELVSGRLAAGDARTAIETVSQAPPASLGLFVLAAAAGATAMGVIFGLQHASAAMLIAVSAGLGAILRRALARSSDNPFLQPFCAALLAGLIGAVAVRFELSSSQRLVAVCPCMILVPGPHVLNGALDLLEGRMHLGAARLVFAGLVVTAISLGLLLGLTVLGVSLPVEVPGRAVPLLLDIVAAGVAVAAFSVFFSTPLTMLVWPVGVGIVAHALRWGSLTLLHSSLAIGAGAAALFVGLVLTPIARRQHMPFAAIGFAAVVSMMPGSFLSRMTDGLMQLSDGSPASLELIGGTMADGMIALTIILALSIGLIVPKLTLDRRGRPRSLLRFP
jgi:uncharacterized membrane protein YjjP (DUF1212 family)